MKAWIVGWAWLACAFGAQAEDIGQVMQRSHETRLAAFEAAPADSPRAARLKAMFERIAAPMRLEPPAQLRVVSGNVVAETMLGHVVVVNELFGDLPEPQLMFLLAHELGHVAGGHWAQLLAVYREYIPGEVTQDRTDAIAAPLGRAASALSYRQELEADRHGLKVLQSNGYGREDAQAFLIGRGLYYDSATHPGTRKRLAQLREADRTEVGATVPSSATEAVSGGL